MRGMVSRISVLVDCFIPIKESSMERAHPENAMVLPNTVAIWRKDQRVGSKGMLKNLRPFPHFSASHLLVCTRTAHFGIRASLYPNLRSKSVELHT